MRSAILSFIVAAWLFTDACSFVLGMRYGHDLAGSKIDLCLATVADLREDRLRLSSVAQRQHCALVRVEPILMSLMPEWRGWWPDNPGDHIECGH